jgi:hypothetical protein
MLPSTRPSTSPLRFLPSRTKTASRSVLPSALHVGVSGGHDDAVAIGPVVVQALPDATRAFRNVGLRGATAVHLEVVIGAVAKELRAARPEVGEPGDKLLGRRCGCLVEMDRGHVSVRRSGSHSETRGHCHQVRKRVGLHLAHDLASVRLHRDLTDAEFAADLFVQQPRNDQCHDLAFT